MPMDRMQIFHPAAALARGRRLQAVGAAVMRCGLAVIFLWFGAMKFTSYEATGVAQFGQR